MKKLHLGCGNRIIPGWINVDINSENQMVIKDDVANLITIEDDSIDLIYASHILEHFGRHEVEGILRTWHKKMKLGGLLRLAVPDFETVCQRYLQHKNISEILGFVSGGQRSVYDYHKIVFDFDSLAVLLAKVGFVDIKRYDWRKTQHSGIDDYSQSYLPHMDKEHGQLMSLNVEASKER